MEKTRNLATPFAKRKARSRAEWLKEVQSLHDSGLRVEEYAAKKGLVLSTLKFWMRALREDIETRTESAVSAFLPVSVRQATAPAASFARMMVEIELANGRRVRMHAKADADFSRMSELLDAVEGGNRC